MRVGELGPARGPVDDPAGPALEAVDACRQGCLAQAVDPLFQLIAGEGGPVWSDQPVPAEGLRRLRAFLSPLLVPGAEGGLEEVLHSRQDRRGRLLLVEVAQGGDLLDLASLQPVGGRAIVDRLGGSHQLDRSLLVPGRDERPAMLHLAPDRFLWAAGDEEGSLLAL